jgi:hypothetical protein
MFVDGRDFSTGSSGFGEEASCSYLTSDEVKEFLGLLKEYIPGSTDEDEKEFVDILIEEFSELADKNCGDLFTVG